MLTSKTKNNLHFVCVCVGGGCVCVCVFRSGPDRPYPRMPQNVMDFSSSTWSSSTTHVILFLLIHIYTGDKQTCLSHIFFFGGGGGNIAPFQPTPLSITYFSFPLGRLVQDRYYFLLLIRIMVRSKNVFSLGRGAWARERLGRGASSPHITECNGFSLSGFSSSVPQV